MELVEAHSGGGRTYGEHSGHCRHNGLPTQSSATLQDRDGAVPRTDMRSAVKTGARKRQTGRYGVSRRNGATSMEQVIGEIWRRLLDLGEIQGTDNLFELGADSLMLVTFAARMESLGIEMGLREIYERPVINELAQLAATRITERARTEAGR
jgi:aryl carrier-like protein